MLRLLRPLIQPGLYLFLGKSQFVGQAGNMLLKGNLLRRLLLGLDLFRRLVFQIPHLFLEPFVRPEFVRPNRQ